MALWQVALTVEASAPTLPKGVTHGSFCSMVQETLKARRRRQRPPQRSTAKSVPSPRRRLTRFSARASQKCVPYLPTDKEMEEKDMFESSLLVVTDQEEDVPFNCDEDVRLRARAAPAGAALTPPPRVPQAVYVEMTFFDVNSAESAANKAIQGLEAKGWQAEIVDPEDMGAPCTRRRCCV